VLGESPTKTDCLSISLDFLTERYGCRGIWSGAGWNGLYKSNNSPVSLLLCQGTNDAKNTINDTHNERHDELKKLNEGEQKQEYPRRLSKIERESAVDTK
jgi:hypothetical protein